MEVEQTSNKITLCVLRTQEGKTFVGAIERITGEIDEDDELGRSIHIVFTMNTLFNTKQFAKRLEDIEDTYGKGSVCVFSSKYNGKYKHIRSEIELRGLCLDETTTPRVIVMCSNTQRYDDGVKFLKVLDKNNTNISRAFAYYDELHEYISENVRSQIEEIHSLEIVINITALTATPDNIFRKTSGFWSKLRLIELDNFNDSNYVGYNDMIFNCIDDFFEHPYVRPKRFDFDQLDKNTVGFIKHVLEKFPEILKEGTRTFIPAHRRRSSHNEVRELVFNASNKKAVVIVMNSKDKSLQYYKNYQDDTPKTIPLVSDDEEVCETISRLIIKHSLQTRPIVITGFLCVGMGQTLTHKSLGSFTSAIFGHMDLTNDELYQLFGRIFGRMKNWGDDKYIQTQVYCPTILMHRCQVMEQCARNMLIEHNGDVVTQEDYRAPMSEMGTVGHSAITNIRKVRVTKEKTVRKNSEFGGSIEIFRHSDGFDLADKYIKEVMDGLSISEDKLKASHYFGKGCHKEGEFIKCALFGKKSKVHSLEDLKNLKLWNAKNVTANFGRTLEDARKSGWAIHLYYGYEDLQNKDTLHYAIRWIRK